MIYTILLLILLLFSMIEMYNSKTVVLTIGNKEEVKYAMDTDKCIAFLLLLVLMLISAFRDETVGRDLLNYIPRYKSLGVASWSTLFEIADSFSFEHGFALLCKLLYLIDPTSAFFLIMTSFGVAIGFYNIIRWSKMPITTLFIIYSFGIYGSSMNVVRQFLAFSILSLSIKYIKEKKFWKFLCIVMLATSIHSMSILFIMVYFLTDFEFNDKSIVAFVLGCVFMAIFGINVVSIFIRRTSFSWYLQRLGQGSGESTLLLLLFILAVFYLLRTVIYEFDSEYNIWIWVLAVTIVSNILALKLGIFARVMKFFLPFLGIIIPDILLALKNKRAYFMLGTFATYIFFTWYFMAIVLGSTAFGEGWLVYLKR